MASTEFREFADAFLEGFCVQCYTIANTTLFGQGDGVVRNGWGFYLL